MRDWKNWLFPLLTCLTALGLAVLPLWLSVREDSQLTGVVHREELREDSNFPSRVPELPGRVRLLAMLESMPDGLTIMDRELEGHALEEASAQARKDLQALANGGVLPPEAVEALEGFSGNRVYLRNRSDLSSASFLELNAWAREQEAYFWMRLDGETGQVLSLQLSGWPMKKSPLDARETGRAFLDRLGLSYTAEGPYEEGRIAFFSLPEVQVQYVAQVYAYDLVTISPQMDWALLEQMAGDGQALGPSAAAGYDA